MERISSNSIFSLATLLSSAKITSIAAWDSTIPTAIDKTNSNTTHSTNDATGFSAELKERPKLYCNSCSVGFEEVKEQHAHYKTEWHRYLNIYYPNDNVD